MSSTGTTISRSSGFRLPASTIAHSRFGPTKNFAIRSNGRWVADNPIRWTPVKEGTPGAEEDIVAGGGAGEGASPLPEGPGGGPPESPAASSLPPEEPVGRGAGPSPATGPAAPDACLPTHSSNRPSVSARCDHRLV